MTIDLRQEIIDELRKDLVGPRAENETIEDEAGPTSWYIAGILFPKNTVFEPEDEETLERGESGDEEEEGELLGERIRIDRSFKQNSIGISCHIKPDIQRVLAEIQYGLYIIMNDETSRKVEWSRKQIRHSLTLDLDKNADDVMLRDGGARIRWTVESSSHYRILTVFLYNDNDTSYPDNVKERDTKIDKPKTAGRMKRHLKNQLSIFQPKIILKSENDSIFPFERIGSGYDVDAGEDEFSPAERTIDLLFRNKDIFAIGFNCATKWEEKSKPSWISTDVLPVFNAKSVIWSSTDDPSRPSNIDMADLAYVAKPSDLDNLFVSITDGYNKWIDRLSLSIKTIDSREKENLRRESHIKTAEEHIEKCRKALYRIREGINLLHTDSEVFDAFVYSCRAMLYQRIRSKFIQERKRGHIKAGARPDYKMKGKNFWRPFQIGFILMNLKGIADPASEDREIADLLWFPTGGGKTEAYLGLSAFTMFLRRIRMAASDPVGHGTSVIMRYTLRLLTIQQFQRAATLLCACERIRRDDIKKWSHEPFLIGLWVGSKSTPNNFSQAKRKLLELANSGTVEESNPVQISSCPWCGDEIAGRNYYADDSKKWIIVHCLNKGCDFYGDRKDVSNALPVLTVDSDIYKRCPSMIIGTVDKFAVMPRRPESATVFGYARRYCEVHGFLTSADSDHPEQSHRRRSTTVDVQNIDELPGPDLIIQDELHLIAGPLGTIVGLYETAIDFLSARPIGKISYKPKVLVSTATVKGVEYQVRKLFDRKRTETFPPPGINAGDSYFWWEVDEGGRKFVGISSPSYSMKTANLRIYASILQKAQELRNTNGLNIDPYWTLVGYFNSRRELGGSLRLLEDDVVRRITAIVDLIDTHRGQEARNIRSKEELTGRIDSSLIPRILLELERDVTSEEVIDVLLATNMIAVGVDVDRLGLMVITGQPKNSAEYIQVVGRVGRNPSAPGLIITLYNPYKPRDLSHYENFSGYHSMLQRYVDPVSVTPFSDRATERALHAVVIALVRLLISEYSYNISAQRFDPDHTTIKRIVSEIKRRFTSVEESDESKDEYLRFSRELDELLAWWVRKKSRKNLKYSSSGKEHDEDNDGDNPEQNEGENILMIDVGSEKRFRSARITPNSMRDIEKESILYYG